jgi:N-acyl-D-amino-acid deacylase
MGTIQAWIGKVRNDKAALMICTVKSVACKLLNTTIITVLLTVPFFATPPQQQVDVLIRNATVVDGYGTKRYIADVAVQGSRIVAVETKSRISARKVIDATGLVLAPGFIDLHNHSEEAIATPTGRLNEGFIRQGVTTVVGGPDGFRSPTQIRDLVAKYKTNGVATNVAFYVGHNAIRSEVMGANQRRPPTADEMQRMKQLVHDGMELGAIGFSSGLMYYPGICSTTDEVAELAKEVKPYGGMYDTHVRDPHEHLLESNAEAIEIGRRAGIPVNLTHLTTPGLQHRGEMHEVVKQIEEARRQGINVVSDQYPYPAVATATLFRTVVFAPSLKVQTPEDAISALKDPEKLARIRHDTIEGPRDGISLYRTAGPKHFEILACPGCRQYEGKFISQIAEEEHLDPFDVIVTLLLQHKQKIIVSIGGFFEEDVQYLMPQPWNMIVTDGDAITDLPTLNQFGWPHPRYTGTYPRVLGHYVRELKLLTLEDAIRKMTSMPADFAGFADRGRIAVGQFADLVLFDPNTIIDRSTWESPLRLPVGIIGVFVNGTAVLLDGNMTGATPGIYVRKEKPSPLVPWP